MNWKITKIGEPVRFEAGMPFMFFNIYNNDLLENAEVVVENLWDKYAVSSQELEVEREETLAELNEFLSKLGYLA
jgi:hypothetical protein